MVVCDGGMVATTAVSLFMNGMCCMWQEKEEHDRRVEIRKAIRSEYWQQRLIDHELQMRRTSNNHNSEEGRSSQRSRLHSDATSTQEERRRQLQLDKMNAMKQNPETLERPPCNPQATTEGPQRVFVIADEVSTSKDIPDVVSFKGRRQSHRSSSSKKRNKTTTTTRMKKADSRRLVSPRMRTGSETSSLFDSELSDDSEDECSSIDSSFTEVALH